MSTKSFTDHMPKIVRLKDVPKYVGISGMHAKRLEKAGMFPKRFQFSPAIKAWYGPEIVAYLDQKVREQRSLESGSDLSDGDSGDNDGGD